MNEAEELRKKLFNIREDGWVKASQEEKDSIFKYADEYINFLNKGKTEREIVAESKEIAEKNGFKNLISFSFNSSTRWLSGRKPRERTTASAATSTFILSFSLSSTTPSFLISLRAYAIMNWALYSFNLPHTSATFV